LENSMPPRAALTTFAAHTRARGAIECPSICWRAWRASTARSHGALFCYGVGNHVSGLAQNRIGPRAPEVSFSADHPRPACGQFALNFRASVSCCITPHKRIARRCSGDGVSAACFAIHFFAAHDSVNSPFQCWVLDGEWCRLQNVDSLALTPR
jgi:hypothetical protein